MGSPSSVHILRSFGFRPFATVVECIRISEPTVGWCKILPRALFEHKEVYSKMHSMRFFSTREPCWYVPPCFLISEDLFFVAQVLFSGINQCFQIVLFLTNRRVSIHVISINHALFVPRTHQMLTSICCHIFLKQGLNFNYGTQKTRTHIELYWVRRRAPVL